jgi:hypothetical protein
MIRHSHIRALGFLVSALLLWPVASLAGHDEVPQLPPASTTEPLKNYKIDRNQVTVSGLSSGGFFAHQFHLAYSGLVNGAGIVAGGPYGCAEQFPFLPVPLPPATAAALYACTHYLGALPFIPTVEGSRTLLQKAQAEGLIDSLDNVRDDRVWLFHGAEDRIVPGSTMETLRLLYQGIGIASDRLVWFVPERGQIGANHGIPISDLRNVILSHVGCGEHKAPFVVQCEYEAAGLMLRHLYPDAVQEATETPHDKGTLLAFNQTAFFDAAEARASMSEVGYLYVPHRCLTEVCRLHVAFHGCRQNVEAVYDDFVRDAGYNRWAATNRLIVLYPQAKPWLAIPLFPAHAANLLANPNGCWDFWGYSGLGYYGQNGKQMRAVKAMIDRLIGP